MINQFIEKLEQLLNQCNISNQEKVDIIDDYKQMIEDGRQKGLSENAIIDMVGNPEKIIKELGLAYKKQERVRCGDKFIALSPFVSLIIFLILGITSDLWHPGWLVFLLIPLSAIIIEFINNKGQYLLTSLSPFISAAFFLICGFQYDMWHPTWLVFIIIPVFAILESKNTMDNLTFFTALSPFISAIAFILIGYFTQQYQYAWLTLLLVVFLGTLHEQKKLSKILLFISLIISTGLYVFLMITYGNLILALSSFLLFIIVAFMTGNINLDFHGSNNIYDKLIAIFSVILFLAVGYFFDLWAVSWLLLLIIPVAMILKYNNSKPFITPLTPFIAVTIFMILGYFFNLWSISWSAFLLIPIVAIIENA